MHRRALLAAVGGTTTFSSAGCLSSLGLTDDASVRLGWFGVHNADTESAHRFDLEVIRDGTRVHESTHEIPAARELEGGGQENDGAVAACTWGDTPGEYTVRVRVDGGDWVEASVAEFARANDADCVIADAEYRAALSIELEAGCDRDGYVGRCPFAEREG